MTVLLKMDINLRKKDMERAILPYELQDRSSMPVTGRAFNYLSNHVVAKHHHPNAQLLHAVHGVMVVSTDVGQWIVPPTRGIWLPAGTGHSTRTLGELHMRSVYIRPDAAPGLPTE